MNRIRINRLLEYYLESLTGFVNRAYAIKKAYELNEISYKRAWRELDRLMTLGWDRVNLCVNLAEKLEIGLVPKIETNKLRLYNLTDWTAD